MRHASVTVVATMPDEPPPVLGTWPRVYTVILIYVAAVIALLALFTATYNR